MLQGMGRGLAQQKPQPGQPGQPGQPPQGQQGPSPTNPWVGGQSPWQGQAAMLQKLGQGLGAQTWGDPGQGAPVINPPQQGRPMPRPIPTVQNAEQLQQGAQQYAAGAMPPGPGQDDPRFRGGMGGMR